MIVNEPMSCRFGIREPLHWLHMLGFDHPGRVVRAAERQSGEDRFTIVVSLGSRPQPIHLLHNVDCVPEPAE